MKKLLLSLSVLGAVLFQACQGPMGPPGMDGLDGIDGVTVEADVFEVQHEGFPFSEENGFSIGGSFQDFEATFLESDKLLMYHLWEIADGRDVWRLLPQTIFVDQGQFQYNYDFTNVDFRIFLQGNFDLNLLDTDWTHNQFFRFVIIPTRAINGRVDYSNYEDVVKFYELDETNIPVIRIEK